MNKVLYLASFALGAGIGFIASKHYFCKKYALKAEKDVAEFLSKISDHECDDPEKDDSYSETEVKIPNEKPNIMEFYKQHIEENGYTDYSTHSNNKSDRVEKVFKGEPYVIRPEEIGDQEGYRTITLTLFDDDILTDDGYDPMDFNEIVACIGDDFKEHFGEYEDDAVHIRNDNLKIDYEILKDYRKYSEMAKFKPGSEE